MWPGVSIRRVRGDGVPEALTALHGCPTHGTIINLYRNTIYMLKGIFRISSHLNQMIGFDLPHRSDRPC